MININRQSTSYDISNQTMSGNKREISTTYNERIILESQSDRHAMHIHDRSDSCALVQFEALHLTVRTRAQPRAVAADSCPPDQRGPDHRPPDYRPSDYRSWRPGVVFLEALKALDVGRVAPVRNMLQPSHFTILFFSKNQKLVTS
jgi:hypothetical protein